MLGPSESPVTLKTGTEALRVGVLCGKIMERRWSGLPWFMCYRTKWNMEYAPERDRGRGRERVKERSNSFPFLFCELGRASRLYWVSCLLYLEIVSLQMSLVKMRSYSLGWALDVMTGVLRRREEDTRRHREKKVMTKP